MHMPPTHNFLPFPKVHRAPSGYLLEVAGQPHVEEEEEAVEGEEEEMEEMAPVSLLQESFTLIILITRTNTI
jgi:hypothetical protein